jgi:hypothetical protein
MRAIAPELDTHVIAIAEGQEEYLTIYAALVAHPEYDVRQPHPEIPAGWNTILLAFKPTPEELEELNKGEAIYFGLLTFGRRMPPVLPLVGKEHAALVYGVLVK